MRFNKITAVAVVLVLVFAVFSSLFVTPENLKSSADLKLDKTVILDAGHPELVRHYRFSDLPPNINTLKTA